MNARFAATFQSSATLRWPITLRRIAGQMRPGFSIITPSYRQLDWLKLCAASVADQEGVILEHLVQDAGSGGEMEEWAAARARQSAGRCAFRFVSEKDQGMYDAINRGLHRAQGEILAYLNCDEQYLPGTLAAVERFFEEHPDVQVAFGHAIVIGPDGGYVCSRKAILPGKLHTWVSGNLAILTCSTFFRRAVVHGRGLLFNPERCAIGDGEWVMRLIDEKIPMAILPHFTSAFLDHGGNMMLSERALREQRGLIDSAPAWARALRPGIVAHYRLRKLLHGAYRQAPLDYSIYTSQSPLERVRFHVAKPSFRWVR
jgi:glycosyltransferase involved in cell wall biosynthesis